MEGVTCSQSIGPYLYRGCHMKFTKSFDVITSLLYCVLGMELTITRKVSTKLCCAYECLKQTDS